jgi:hypothetical protein
MPSSDELHQAVVSVIGWYEQPAVSVPLARRSDRAVVGVADSEGARCRVEAVPRGGKWIPRPGPRRCRVDPPKFGPGIQTMPP